MPRRNTPPARPPASQADKLPSVSLESAARACPLLLDVNGEEWVACCTHRFLPLARRIANGNDQALDDLQTSWIKVLQGVHAYRGGPPACAWVGTIVANSAKSSRRDNARASRIPVAELVEVLEDPLPDPETIAQYRQMYILLKAMIAEMPQIYRQVIELRYEQQLSTSETADLLQVSRSSVATRLWRAEKLLRRLMNARIRTKDATEKRAETTHRPGAKRSRESVPGPRPGDP